MQAYIIGCANAAVHGPKIGRQDLEDVGAGEGIRTLDPTLATRQIDPRTT
jgi:hypothetical protein